MPKVSCRTEPVSDSAGHHTETTLSFRSFAMMQGFKCESGCPSSWRDLQQTGAQHLYAIYSILGQETQLVCCLDVNLMSWSSEDSVCGCLQSSQSLNYSHNLCSYLSFLGSVPCCFLQASLSNPVVDTTGNLIAPNPFCSTRINIPLKALPSEEPSPLQLPSALAKSSLLMLIHRTSFHFLFWGEQLDNSSCFRP